jgi:hypothetical protein
MQWRVLLVLLALVCAQALGFMHRVAHEGHVGGSAHGEALHGAHQAGVDVQVGAGDSSSAEGWLQALFALHENETDCRLYDGVGPQALACPAVTPVDAIAPTASYLSLLSGDFVARWAALFDARGPPLSR